MEGGREERGDGEERRIASHRSSIHRPQKVDHLFLLRLYLDMVCVCVCERASHVYCVRRVLKHTHTHTHTHIHTIKDKCQCPVITLLPLSIHLPPPVSPSLPRSVSTLQSLPIKRCLSEEPFIIRATADVSSEVFLTRWKFKKTPTCMFMFLKDTFFKMNV